MFDARTITIPCPNCGQQTDKTIGWIKNHDDFICPGCDRTLTLDKEDLLSGLDAAQKALDGLTKSLGGGKR